MIHGLQIDPAHRQLVLIIIYALGMGDRREYKGNNYE